MCALLKNRVNQPHLDRASASMKTLLCIRIKSYVEDRSRHSMTMLKAPTSGEIRYLLQTPDGFVLSERHSHDRVLVADDHDSLAG